MKRQDLGRRSRIVPGWRSRAVAAAGVILLAIPAVPGPRAASVPFTLDHNRLLIDAEVQRPDGSWRPARLWVDSGNPSFMMTDALARDTTGSGLPRGVRVGGLDLDLADVPPAVVTQPSWLSAAMRNDGNLPSTILKRYQVTIDYPRRRLTLSPPGSVRARGVRVPAGVHPTTGIVQVDVTIDGEPYSFALDIGASYSFVSSDRFERLAKGHPGWPRHIGAVGCANIWGRWPGESEWPMVRVPEMGAGAARLADVGLVGLAGVFQGGLAEWYSRKTLRHVDGFLGPNALKAFRVEIDYARGAVFFEKTGPTDQGDATLVGLTLQPDADRRFHVIGVPLKDGRPAVEGVAVGDILLRVGTLDVTGETTGTVVDALRGRAGEGRTLELEREGRRFQVEAKVVKFF